MSKLIKVFQCLLNPHYYYSYIHLVSPLFELKPLLNNVQNLSTLIDIGSNKGQFILLVKKKFPNLKIYSFEPQIDQLNIQKKILSKFKINYFNIALGSKNEKRSFFITNRKDSSSLLQPNLKIKTYKVKKEIQINVHKAKDVLNKYKIKNPLLVKIDVQGFEKEVLDGFGSKIKNIDYIIIEESYFNVYKNQKKNLEIKNFLKKKKFKLIKSCNLTFYENKLFQRDALYKNVSNN